MSTETRARERFNREMQTLGIKIDKLRTGYGDDTAHVKGLRSFVGMMWEQVTTTLPQAEQALTDASLVKGWEETLG